MSSQPEVESQVDIVEYVRVAQYVIERMQNASTEEELIQIKEAWVAYANHKEEQHLQEYAAFKERSKGEFMQHMEKLASLIMRNESSRLRQQRQSLI